MLLRQPAQGRHWARQYMGKPWINGGQGPEAFDCWGLVRHVLAEHFNIQVPTVDIDPDCLRGCIRALQNGKRDGTWRRVKTPGDGDVVLMAHAKYPSHIGIWLHVDAGGILHCLRGCGVVYSTPIKLRLSGWGGIEYYRYNK